MSDYATLKAAIQSAVYTNGNNEITGAGLQSVLLQIVNTVGTGYVFKGVATAGTAPGTPDANVFYIGGEGEYNNFGSRIKVPKGFICVFLWNGAWSKSMIDTGTQELRRYVDGIIGGVFTYDATEFESSGYVKYNTGELTAGGYVTSDFVKVSKGDKIETKSYGSTAVAIISAYSSASESAYIRASSVAGSSTMGGDVTYNVPNGVSYVRFSCHGSYLGDMSVTITTSEGIASELSAVSASVNEVKLSVEGGSFNFDSALLSESGWINYQNGVLNNGGYSSSDYIPVSEGDVVSFTRYGSTAVAVLSAYTAQDASAYVKESSRQGSDSVSGDTITYIVPTGIYFIRISCNNLYLTDFSATITKNGLSERVTLLEQGGASPFVYDNFMQTTSLLKKNRVSISFSFDDGLSEDDSIKAVFDSFGLKCGFAIITAQQKYYNFARDGFEILAHGTSPLSTADEATIRAAMVSGKSVVESLGLVCHGWVTPSSALPSALRYVTNDYFEYGYTIYRGDVPTGQTMTSSLKSYGLWRVHMTTFLQNYASIISDAVSNNGMIAVYGHGNEITNNTWSLNDLATLLQYCQTNMIDVLTPYRSCLRLFEQKHNE